MNRREWIDVVRKEVEPHEPAAKMLIIEHARLSVNAMERKLWRWSVAKNDSKPMPSYSFFDMDWIRGELDKMTYETSNLKTGE